MMIFISFVVGFVCGAVLLALAIARHEEASENLSTVSYYPHYTPKPSTRQHGYHMYQEGNVGAGSMIEVFDRLYERLNMLASPHKIPKAQYDACARVLDESLAMGSLPQSVAMTDASVGFGWLDEDECFTVEVREDGSFYLFRSNIETFEFCDDSYSAGVNLRGVLSDWLSQRAGRL